MFQAYRQTHLKTPKPIELSFKIVQATEFIYKTPQSLIQNKVFLFCFSSLSSLNDFLWNVFVVLRSRRFPAASNKGI